MNSDETTGIPKSYGYEQILLRAEICGPDFDPELMCFVNRLKSEVKHKYSNAQIFGKNVSCIPDPKTLVACAVI